MKTDSLKTCPKLFVLAAFSTGLSQAAVVVADSGTTTPIIGASDTGYTGTTANRFGWDAGEGLTQTFTVPTEGTVQSIFMGYNAFNDGETITLDLLVNGNLVESGLVLNGDNFSGDSSSDDNTQVFYWMEFDLSAENVSVTSGTNSFTLNATADTGDSWALAPRYNNADPYDGGELSLDFAGLSDPSDLAFGVTVDPIPEPSSLALIVLGACGLAGRRRR